MDNSLIGSKMHYQIPREEKEIRARLIFEEKMAENFPELMKNIHRIKLNESRAR